MVNEPTQPAYKRVLLKLTGESLTTAVTEAVRERLNRIRHERGADLGQRLLAIGPTIRRL